MEDLAFVSNTHLQSHACSGSGVRWLVSGGGLEKPELLRAPVAVRGQAYCGASVAGHVTH